MPPPLMFSREIYEFAADDKFSDNLSTYHEQLSY